MPKIFTSPSQKIGEIGETTACQFLMKQGFSILERNYTKKWGEIDIIALRADAIHFIEVKSVSHMPNKSEGYRPEDNLHPWKMKRLARAIQTYLLERHVPENKNWQFDVCTVYLDLATGDAQVNLLENIIL